MKRILAALLVIVLLIPCAGAEVYDYSGMALKELIDNYNAIRLAVLELMQEQKGYRLIFGNDLFQIYSTGHGTATKEYFDLNIIFANTSEKPLEIRFDNISINGWSVKAEPFRIESTLPQTRKASYIRLYYPDASLDDWHKMEDIQIKFHTLTDNIFDDDYTTSYGPIVFLFGEWQ